MTEPDQPTAPPPAIASRFTVALTYRGTAAMENLEQRTGLKRTDLVNRAVQLYDILDTDLADGGKLMILWPDGTMQRIVIT